MANFLKKALGLFVEFEPNEKTDADAHHDVAQKFPLSNIKASKQQILTNLSSTFQDCLNAVTCLARTITSSGK
jgi:hypothetical protein